MVLQTGELCKLHVSVYLQL